MTTYTLNKGQQGEEVLLINGLQSVCPFIDPIPMKGNVGQIQIMRLPCSTTCPHASIKDVNKYHINCGSSEQVFVIEEADESTPPKTLELVP